MPRKGTLPSGEPCSVIILDTEGIGGIESDSQYDARIFSLALLLCSTLIYNSMGSIDEAAISNLSFVAQLSNHIKLSGGGGGDKDKKSNGVEDESINFHKIFPSFLWVIRDFSLQLVDSDGDVISGSQYLNNALQPVKGFDKQTVERNRIRSMLSSFFSNRECLTLVRPCNSEEQLQQVDLIPFKSLRSEFQDAIGKLRSLVFDNLVQKTMECKALNGIMFAGLVDAYVSAVNSGGVPTLSTAWESISEEECCSAYENAVKLYETDMDSYCGKNELPMESIQLQAFHDQVALKASQFYSARAVGMMAAEYQKRLESEINKLCKEYNDLNELESKEFCSHLAETIFGQKLASMLSDENLVSESNFITTFKKEWNEFSEKYNKTPSKGPAAQIVLSNFYFTRFLNSMELFSVVVRESFTKEIRKLQNEIRDLSSALSIVTTERNVLHASNAEKENKLNEAEKNLRNFTSRCSQQEAALNESNDKLRVSKKAEEELKDNLERAENKLSGLNNRVAEQALSLKQLDELKITVAKQAEEIRNLQEEAIAAKEELSKASKEKKSKKQKCVIS